MTLLVVICLLIIQKRQRLTVKPLYIGAFKMDILQFELNRWHNPAPVFVVPYDINNRGASYYTYKPFTSKTDKAVFFNAAFKWLKNYIEYQRLFDSFNLDKTKLSAKLKGCKYTLSPEPLELLGFFKRLKKLKSMHFEGVTFSDFMPSSNLYLHRKAA
jgi:hypothetical protein